MQLTDDQLRGHIATAERHAIRWLTRVLAVVILVALLVWPADYAQWRIRTALGRGMDTITVRPISLVDIKGGKTLRYPGDLTTVPCSKSLFTQSGAGACWWLRRHPELDSRY